MRVCRFNLIAHRFETLILSKTCYIRRLREQHISYKMIEAKSYRLIEFYLVWPCWRNIKRSVINSIKPTRTVTPKVSLSIFPRKIPHLCPFITLLEFTCLPRVVFCPQEILRNCRERLFPQNRRSNSQGNLNLL